jgi:ATP-dependent Clp protease ATP-binding subunit ClpX
MPASRGRSGRDRRGDAMRPRDINGYLQDYVIGQEEVLQYVSVAIFKHLQGEPYGNLMLIGNSGTGKTTVMRDMERLYMEHEEFAKYRVVIIMNANTFSTAEGVIDFSSFYQRLEDRARQILGKEASAAEIAKYMEHATVCLDEIDKCSGIVGGKPYVTGINIQQALLTLIEGERVDHSVTVTENGAPKREVVHLDTSKMLFLCAGAFETLYDQVYERVTAPTSRVKLPTETVYVDGEVQIREFFNLRHHYRQEDLFDFGMQPQFLSRFDNSIILEDLHAGILKRIFLDTPDSVFRASRSFFKNYGIELEITDGAAQKIAEEAAAHSRIGARALKSVYGRIIKPFEFDPDSAPQLQVEGDCKRLVIDEAMVAKALESPIKRFQ